MFSYRQPSKYVVCVMASTDDALAIAGLILAMKKLKKPKRYRTVWCKNWLRKENNWHNYLRMDEETYLKLLSMVTPFIKKQILLCVKPYHTRKTDSNFKISRYWEEL
nr:unnamed protein product [Callosobruchus analis]